MELKLWKDKNKNLIDPELFSSKAEELAKKIFNEKTSKANKTTQIRKFYEEVLRFDSITKTNPSEFESVLPYLKMINAKAAYAAGRDLISSGFKDFISDSLKQVNDRKDFEVFASLFESFIGYYKFYYEKNETTVRGGRR